MSQLEQTETTARKPDFSEHSNATTSLHTAQRSNFVGSYMSKFSAVITCLLL